MADTVDTGKIQSDAMHPFTLAFLDNTLESTFQADQPERLLQFVRMALLIVVPVFALFGLLDPKLIPDTNGLAWEYGLYVILSVLLVLGLTFVPWFFPYIQWALFALVLLFGVCIVALSVFNRTTVDDYYVGLILLMMFSYFSGLRFIYAINASTVIVLAYVIVVLATQDAGLKTLLFHLPFLGGAFLITGFAGYSSERQRRYLFCQAIAIDEERKKHEKMALHDPLTGLPNRNLFEERMDQALARSKRQDTQFAVMFADIDNFKTINDNYGHLIGDQVLKTIASRLREHLRTEDSIARLGGDEFVILSENIHDEEGVQVTASRLLESIADPIVINLREHDTIEINVTGSIGISVAPRDGRSIDQLVKKADEAMYDVKQSGKKGYKFYGSKTLENPEIAPPEQASDS